VRARSGRKESSRKGHQSRGCPPPARRFAALHAGEHLVEGRRLIAAGLVQVLVPGNDPRVVYVRQVAICSRCTAGLMNESPPGRRPEKRRCRRPCPSYVRRFVTPTATHSLTCRAAARRTRHELTRRHRDLGLRLGQPVRRAGAALGSPTLRLTWRPLRHHSSYQA
jgi:hypothetical protein